MRRTIERTGTQAVVIGIDGADWRVMLGGG